MKNTLHKKYKGGNKLAKRGGGVFDFFNTDKSTKEGASDGENQLTKMIGSATEAAKGATGYGVNDGVSLTKERESIKRKYEEAIADAEAKYKKESEANETKKIELQAELQDTKKKIAEEHQKATEAMEKKIADAKEDAQRTLNSLNSAQGSAPGSAPGQGMGGGRRRRSGARRSGARRSAARNGRSAPRRSGARRSKTKKRITRKKNRNHKKRTRRYKKQ